mmetsp:Transcript_58324/g.86721  ORF Transcript_58324/g.86721 Transcript_58324/m.86721 type:complete len:156 (-) Transcript_58324:448-915(-)
MIAKNETCSIEKNIAGRNSQSGRKWDECSLPSIDDYDDNYYGDDHPSDISEGELCGILNLMDLLEEETYPICFDTCNEVHEDIQFNNHQINYDLSPRRENIHDNDAESPYDMELIQKAASAFQNQEHDRYKRSKIIKSSSVRVECQTFSRTSRAA